jgi:GMP synthase PP-ATPase subunit
MIIGEMLRESASARHSPWFDRRGDKAVFGCRALAVSGAKLDFRVTVQTKDLAGTDADTSEVVQLPRIDAVGTVADEGSGLRELVRYRYDVGSDPPTGDEWVHFEMLDPQWCENQVMP